ncbi:hypothetical protein [Bilifractor porci]|jgi:hypothetical protein|uniref:Uncharacterized protein n=1 Tax=Bilifractor porci TaxID=2606636 RepID=A0A7X2TMP8_9FIRM|nr:hypothetical protein [Bilifractor porci]MST81444.1 hypothetical protein [Bilifractor porci]
MDRYSDALDAELYYSLHFFTILEYFQKLIRTLTPSSNRTARNTPKIPNLQINTKTDATLTIQIVPKI